MAQKKRFTGEDLWKLDRPEQPALSPDEPLMAEPAPAAAAD